MTLTTPLNENHERRIRALEALLPAVVLDLIQRDPHQWSTRGCGTCKAITSMIGLPFGCYRYRIEKHTLKEPS